MATVAGIKIKTKSLKVRNPIFADEKYTGSEPEWPAEAVDWPDDKFDSWLRRSFYYYNYYYSQKDTKKYVVDWMRHSAEFSKEEIKAFERSSDRACPMTAHSLIMAHRKGMQFRGRHLAYINQSIQEAIAKAEPEDAGIATPEQVVNRPTIQDRMNERTSELIGELEGYYDDIDTQPVNFYNWLTNNNVIQSQLQKYEAVFIARKQELELAQSKADEQLVEGYKHLKAADFKKRIKWIDDLLSAIEQYRGVKKATKKVRAPRAVSKEKLVAKLKYAKENKELKVISINPADIIGSKELWVYNVKTRKLGKYVAEEYKDLAVKGTTIVNFSEAKSVQKTIRKPEEKLKEFAKAGKIQLRKFMDDIKATETKLNGRINADTVLLRVQ